MNYIFAAAVTGFFIGLSAEFEKQELFVLMFLCMIGAMIGIVYIVAQAFDLRG